MYDFGQNALASLLWLPDYPPEVGIFFLFTPFLPLDNLGQE